MIYRDSKGRFCKKEHAINAVVKGYKGFHPGLRCLNEKQYKVGKIFTEDKAIPCKAGMHFCKNPIDVLRYYPPVDYDSTSLNEYARVEALDNPKTKDNQKYCSKHLKICNKLDIESFVIESFYFNGEHAINRICNDTNFSVKTNVENYTKISHKNNNSQTINRGKYSVIHANDVYFSELSNGGDYSVISSGAYKSVISNIGNFSAIRNIGSSNVLANSGMCSISISIGMENVIGITGFRNVAISTGTHNIICSTGICSVVKSNGDFNIAVNNAKDSSTIVTGEQSIAINAGRGGKVKAALGCWIACAEWDFNRDCMLDFKSAYVDGKEIKADTWYKLENGKFVEVN